MEAQGIKAPSLIRGKQHRTAPHFTHISISVSSNKTQNERMYQRHRTTWGI